MVIVPTPINIFRQELRTNEVPADLKTKLNGYMNGMMANP